MGGEKTVKVPALVVPTGSPPRGRGKGKGTRFDALRIGITPAWAGKSAVPVVIFSIAWDHPRVGGEKAAFHA